MLEQLHSFFSSGSFIPHGHCYLWNKELVWLHLLSDAFTALAYYSIPATLVYFTHKRSDLPFNWIFWLFSIFIVACGTTHLMDVWTLWYPIYWVSGTIKAMTAIISVYTAVMMFPLIPQALALPSPAELQTQVRERHQAEMALRQAYDQLEQRIQARTADLATVNQFLQAEVSNRQQTEARLQEVLMLQRAILDSANYTIISTTVDGTVTTFNRAAEHWLGYTTEEVVGKISPAILHDREEVIQRSQELSQELNTTVAPGFEAFVAKARLGEPDEQEWSYIRKDGTRFPVLLSVTALRNSEGQITGFLGIGSDITKRKQDEGELRWNAALLRAMANASPLAFLVIDNRTDKILYFNHRFCEIWGIESLEEQMQRGELKNNDIIPYCLQVLADIPAFTESCKPLQSESNRIVIEDEIPFIDGRTIRRFSGQIRDDVDRYFGRLYLFEDITERKQTEKELQAMSQTLESAVEGISQLDVQGRYMMVNPAYASMVGYQPEDMIGLNWQATVYPDDLEKMSNAYQHMLAQGRVEVEARAVRKDGSVFDKQVLMISAFDAQQQFIGHYCFMKDISERREIERLKDEFISVVSHELRTPLTSISAALDLLAGGVLQTKPADAQRMLTIAANNTDRLVRLINDILDIERIESGKVTMTKQSCNVADLMTQSIAVIQEMADQAEIRLEVEPISVQVWADSDRIIQVLTNLLSNAIKFSPSGSTISLTAETKAYEPSLFNLQAASYVLFKVQDQGRGIPEDKLESIFERFQQVDASDSRQRGGTGLGLAICRSILQQHGGQIWASSTLGVGSTFWFTLPITDAFASALACDVTQFAPPLILECDDDPSVRAVIQALLERQGYRVLSVESGAEAVKQASQVHPAVILLNLMMPEMNGWETLAALKQQQDTQSIPVIILSGVLPNANEPHPEISDWIVKPPDPRRLYQALEHALAKPDQTIRVLIVEDDRDLAQVLSTLFTQHGIATYCAQTGREAIQLSQQVIPDLLVLDLGLPECDGFVVVDWLQQHNRLCSVPLVIYTARDLDHEDRDRLQLGETLILTKGRISPQEFEQRVIQLLNRIVQVKQREASL
jgi:PAS domain S-box-containing protein